MTGPPERAARDPMRESMIRRNSLDSDGTGVAIMVYFKWFGTVLLAILSLAVGLVPFIDSWPRWLFVAIGVAAVIAAFFMFPWTGKPDPPESIRQNMTTGDNSRSIQSAGDVNLNGGMGDRR